ncbi:MAG: hypothetical protein HC822_15125 [Oscillochloris sp.]|nr:hypothetical protein [Oscillochloris sp.]
MIDPALVDREVHGRAATCRAFLATFRGRITEVADHARTALATFEPGSPWRGAAAIALGDALSLSGKPAAAAEAYAQALEAAADNGYVALNAGYKLAGTQRLRGQLHAAADTCRRHIQLAERIGMAESALAGCLYALYGDLLAEWERLPEALDLTARAMECSDQGRHIGLSGWIVLYRARCLLLAGDRAAAQATIDGLDFNRLPPWIASPLTAIRALILLADGNIAAAEALMAGRSPIPAGDGELLVQVRLLARRGDHTAALEMLDRAAERCRASGLNGMLVVVALSRCTLLHQLGRRDEAVAALREALVAGMPGGFRRSFRDAGPAVASGLEAATTPELQSYVNEIKARSGEFQMPAGETLLSEREREVLELIAAGLKNREIAERLLISLNTVLYHSKHLYGKLGASSRTQVLQAARARGIL